MSVDDATAGRSVVRISLPAEVAASVAAASIAAAPGASASIELMPVTRKEPLQRSMTAPPKPTAAVAVASAAPQKIVLTIAADKTLAPDSTASERVKFISIFVWGGAFFLYVGLGFYLTALAYDVWAENPNNSQGKTVEKVAGKFDLQWALLTVGCVFGAVGAGCLTGRLFGARRSPPALKYLSVLTTIVMLTLGYLATSRYPKPDRDEFPRARLGAGWEYGDSAFNYGAIGVLLLIAHEVLVRLIQRLRTRHHLASEARKHLLLVREQPMDVVHAAQGLLVQQQLEAEGVREALNASYAAANSSSSSSSRRAGNDEDDAPPGSRPSSVQAGTDVHLDALEAKLLADKDTLSSGQLNLLFSLLIFFYIVQVGGVAYAAIEGWDLRQGVQFAVVTLATIGFGDIVPLSTLGRALLFVYFPLGFGVLSYTISLVWSQLFGKAEEHLTAFAAFTTLYCARPCRNRRRRKAVQAAKEAAIARHVARKRAAAAGGAASPVITAIVIQPADSAEIELTTLNKPPPVEGVQSLFEEEDDLAREEDEELRALEADAEAQAAAEMVSGGEAVSRGPSSTDFKLGLSLVFVLFLLLGGAAVFAYYESTWTYFEAVYFCFITLTTIGFGDFAPTTPESKTFIIYYIMVGLGAIAFVLSLINDKISKKMAILKGISAAEALAAEEAAAKAELAESMLPLSRAKSLNSLPTWNERFLAANFTLEALGETFTACQKNRTPPSLQSVHELQAVLATLASLGLTIGQRQGGGGGGNKRDAAPGLPADAASSSSATVSFGLAPEVLEAEDELDLSSYGIVPLRLPFGAPPTQQQSHKKHARVALPRVHAVAPAAVTSAAPSLAPGLLGQISV